MGLKTNHALSSEMSRILLLGLISKQIKQCGDATCCCLPECNMGSFTDIEYQEYDWRMEDWHKGVSVLVLAQRKAAYPSRDRSAGYSF